MKYLSLFSGIGGFELGIQQAFKNSQNLQNKQDKQYKQNITSAKWQCVGYSEINKYARIIYEKHFSKHKNFGDATKIETNKLPNFDLLVGGFPCQAFSIAGKRQGFNDSRGEIFFEVARILRDKRPKYLLLENVRGLLSHDSGKTFQTILKVLTNLGYQLEWQILNSKNFGVPQNRERIYIIGYFRTTPKFKIFPIRKNSQENIILPTITTRITADSNGTYLRKKQTPQKSQMIIGGSQGNRLYGINGISVTVSSNGGGLGGKSGLYAIPTLTPNRIKKRQNGRRFKNNGEPMFTLTGQDIHGIYDGFKIRRLTPVECERLQGFPDNWSAGISDNQRYKCLGNAVTVNVIKAIIQKLILNISKSNIAKLNIQYLKEAA